MADKDDDVEIDFSKVTSFFKGKKKPEHQKTAHHEEKKQPEEHKHTEHKKEEDEEASIDLSFIKNMFKGGSKKQTPDKEDDIGFDMGAATAFFKSKPWIITLLLLIFVVWMTVDVRMAASNLAFTESFAQNSVDQYFRSQVEAQVLQQSPNLPSELRAQVVNEQYQQFVAANRDYLNNQIVGTSLFYKTAWMDEAAGDCRNDFNWLRCKPYMPDIDPYYWYRYARNIEEKGHIGDEIKNGEDWDNHMLAPNGRPITNPDKFHPHMLVFFHSIIGIFIPGITLYQATFFYPVIISAFSVIFVFLIARRIAGNVGGLFAAAMFTYNFSALNRTLFGHADTDTWVIFFPILITWLFLESFHTLKTRWVLLYTGLAGLAVGVYSIAWGGWWYIFDFIVAMSGLYVLYHILTHWKALRKDPRAALRIDVIKNGVLIPISFVVSSGIFVSLLNSLEVFLYVPLNALGFTRLKDAVLPTLWPNVLTTVAELNEGNLGSVIGAVGGPLLFYIALLGIGFTMLTIGKNNKQYLAKDDTFFVIFIAVWYGALLLGRNSIGDVLFLVLLFIPVLIRAVMAYLARKRIDIGVAILLSIWFAGTTYATFKGIRFTLLLAPAFAVAFGVVFGVLFTLLWRWLDAMNTRKLVKSSVMIVVFGLFFFIWFWPPGLFYLHGGSIATGAYNIAESDVPIVNDAWWTSLKAIEADSQPNAIITSWWDFGHHFKAIADRPVTFDGTTQDTPQAHWVGKTFLTSSEREAKGILQMLACGGNDAFNELKPLVDNDTVRTVKIINTLTVTDKANATRILRGEGLSADESERVLRYTHCAPPELYLISSDDMIGKAGVWAHFGAWNFEKAYIWQFLREKPLAEAAAEMQNKFNYTQKQAEDAWYEVQAITSESEANGWVSPWPGYLGTGDCAVQGAYIACGVNLQNQPLTLLVNTTNREARIGVSGQDQLIPNSIVYVENESVRILRFTNPTFGFSFALLPQGAGYSYVVGSSELIEGMFTRTFYLQGHGLKYFTPLTHQTSIAGTNIFVYKVDWDGGEPNLVQGFMPAVERTAIIDYIGYLPDGTIFDSSIIDWREKNITSQSSLAGRNDTSPISFTLGSGGIIQGVDLAVSQMKPNETKIVEVPPELGYGTEPDPNNPLAGQTIVFRIFVHSILP